MKRDDLAMMIKAAKLEYMDHLISLAGNAQERAELLEARGNMERWSNEDWLRYHGVSK